MAVTADILRYTHDTTNVTSVTVPVLVAVAAGARLVVAIDAPVTGSVTSFTITDSKANTYTVRSTQNAASINYQLALADSVLTTALATTDTVTITVAGASPAKWCVNAISVDNLSGYDTQATASGSSTTPNSGPTAVAAQDTELVVGVVGYPDAGSAVTFTPDGGLSALAKVTSSPASAPRSMVLCYGYVSAAGTRTFSGTLSASNPWGAIVGAYKQVLVGSPGAYGDPLQKSMNRVAGTTGLDAQGAANVWAGTTGLDLLGALNVKNGTTGLGLNLVLNNLAGTSGLDADGAAVQIIA